MNYMAGGVDLTAYVERWLDMLDSDAASMRGLLEHVNEEYSYGAHFMMANIGPLATQPSAENEALLPFGVLAAYQDDDFPGAPIEWAGTRIHLSNAFAYARLLGDRGVAENLLEKIADRSTRGRPAMFVELLENSLGNEPSRIAAHEQDMAGLEAREVRSDALFDSTVDIDVILLSHVSDS